MAHPSITVKAATPVPPASSPTPGQSAKASTATASAAVVDTPSLKAILSAFERDGNGDTELLKSILRAKEKEDERLAAEHALRVEQLKVQQTLVVSQVQLYYAQMQLQQQQYAAAMQQQQQHQVGGAQANSKSHAAAYAPYSPTSPPATLQNSPYMTSGNSAQLQPCPPVVPQHPAYGLSPRSSTSPPPTSESLKRSRAGSTVSSNSTSSTSASSSSAYTHQLQSIQQGVTEPNAKKARRSPPAKPNHDDVMAALRLKCERNQSINGWASQQRQQVPAPPVIPPATVSSKKRQIAPREPSAESSMQGPAARSKSRTPPLRHTAHVARAPDTVKSEPVEAPSPAPAVAAAEHDAGHSSSFRMLLNASEAIAAGAA